MSGCPLSVGFFWLSVLPLVPALVRVCTIHINDIVLHLVLCIGIQGIKNTQHVFYYATLHLMQFVHPPQASHACLELAAQPPGGHHLTCTPQTCLEILYGTYRQSF